MRFVRVGCWGPAGELQESKQEVVEARTGWGGEAREVKPQGEAPLMGRASSQWRQPDLEGRDALLAMPVCRWE